MWQCCHQTDKNIALCVHYLPLPLPLQSRVQVTAALYQMQSVAVEVRSPFKQAGEFEVLLYESSDKTLLHTMSPTAR